MAPETEQSTYPTGVFIGGRWLESATRFDVVDPATEQTITSVVDAGPEHARAAMEAASGASESWAATTPRDR